MARFHDNLHAIGAKDHLARDSGGQGRLAVPATVLQHGVGMRTIRHPSSRAATRLAFVVAGFTSACWAPLVPFAKLRLGVNDAELGVLLLSFGAGSILGVSTAGLVATRVGSRPVVIAGGIGLCLLLPTLPIAGTALTLAASLFLFGAFLGALDVAMNAHGVEVEKTAGVALMSGFHALFSLGGFAGAGWMTLGLRFGLSAFAATVVAALAALALVAAAAAGLLRTPPMSRVKMLVAPSGLVAMIAGMAAVMFLAEGAVFDWSALLLIDRRLADPAEAGSGFILFSVAMTVGRLTGDRIIGRYGDRRALQWGGALAVFGLAFVLACPGPLAIAGFLLVGLGAANAVPILFSAAGRQTSMPPTLAVAAVTSVGYIGMLAGPPLVGLVAHVVGLPTAFWILAGLALIIPLLAWTVTE
jgi:predicted MFS family arabinose efflux permease